MYVYTLLIIATCTPVAQIRNHKGRKTSKYAPEEGNRYDGIYKVRKNTVSVNATRHAHGYMYNMSCIHVAMYVHNVTHLNVHVH